MANAGGELIALENAAAAAAGSSAAIMALTMATPSSPFLLDWD